MKVNLENKYLGIPFPMLLETVFSPNGDLNRCDKSAYTALVLRLEKFYGRAGFGLPGKGLINGLEAYLAAEHIVSHGFDA